MCRYWRKTLLQCPELWSEVFLLKGEDYVKTFLKRAKESPLEIVVDYEVPVKTIALLPPLTKQIRTLNFLNSRWADFQRFSEVTSGLLPHLHTLTIDFTESHTHITEEDDMDDLENNPPSLPLFSDAVDLKALRFHSASFQSPFVLHFVFPNLVSFDLSMIKQRDFDASQLFDFLESSPMLQIVYIEVLASIFLKEVPQERVISLLSVEKFTLIVGDEGPGYAMAAHIHCPSARVTSMLLKSTFEKYTREIFPTSDSWNTILRHYTRSPIEEVTLEIRPGPAPLTCKLTFGSPDATTINFSFIEIRDSADYDEYGMRYPGPPVSEIFAQATRAIRNHPQLANIKRLRISHSFRPSGYFNDAQQTVKEVRRLFNFLGPLDEMTIYHCDLQLYFRLFLVPPTKKLILLHPIKLSGCTAGLVSLAKMQHARGMPFERVVIRSEELPEGIEGLILWVGSVEYSCEKLRGCRDEWGPR